MIEDVVDAKYGKKLPYERNIKPPIWRKRSCTDVLCLFIFIAFLIGWGFVAQYASRYGDLNKLVVPTDSYNRKCGLDSGVLDKKYLFFFNLDKCIDPLVPITGCPTPQVCVHSCPQETFIWDTMKNQMSIDELKQRLICLTDSDKENIITINDAEKAIAEERCARWYIKSAPFLKRCMWEFSPEVCEYIPAFLLKQQRNQRDLTSFNGTNTLTTPKSLTSAITLENSYTNVDKVKNEKKLQALVLSMFPILRTSRELYDNEMQLKARKKSDQLNEEPPIAQCKRRTELGETVIREKMQQTDTKLSKLMGNIVAHFTNGTHEAQRIGELIVEDIINSYPIVLGFVLVSMLMTFIFIALLRWLAGPFLWSSIFGVLIGLIVAIYYSVKEYKFYHNEPTVPEHGLHLNAAVKTVLQDERLWLTLSIFLGVFFIILLLLLIILRSRINIAVALIREGSKAVSSVKSTVFFPLISWLLFIAAIAFAVFIGLYLGSIGQNSFRMIHKLNDGNDIKETCICEGLAANYTLGNECQPNIFEENCYKDTTTILNTIIGFTSGKQIQKQRQPCLITSCSFVEIEHPTLIQLFIVYNVFGYLWLTFFIAAFTDMVLAVTFATWYWTFRKRDIPFFTLTRAIGQTLFYHVGTLAFGSLILAICRLIRIMLEYVDRKLKKYDNSVTRAILCFFKFFFWLLENFLRFLSKNAYIMCAINGKNFCTSARDAFNLTMRNFLRVITLDKVTDFLFFMSKLLITGLAGVATYFFIVENPQIIQLNYAAVPTAIVSLLAFLITSVFFSVYSMAVDTLFLCFLEDIERNDGSPEKPYYMSKHLMKILGKRNKMPNRKATAPAEMIPTAKAKPTATAPLAPAET